MRDSRGQRGRGHVAHLPSEPRHAGHGCGVDHPCKDPLPRRVDRVVKATRGTDCLRALRHFCGLSARSPAAAGPGFGAPERRSPAGSTRVRHHRSSRASHAARDRSGASCGATIGSRPHRGRDGNGQGAGGEGHASGQPAPGTPLRRRQLRRSPARSRGIGALRPREGCIHGRRPDAQGVLRGWRAAAHCFSTKSGSCRHRRR